MLPNEFFDGSLFQIHRSPSFFHCFLSYDMGKSSDLCAAHRLQEFFHHILFDPAGFKELGIGSAAGHAEPDDFRRRQLPAQSRRAAGDKRIAGSYRIDHPDIRCGKVIDSVFQRRNTTVFPERYYGQPDAHGPE